MSNFYDLSANTINGILKNFTDFKGKKLLVVNTASECGLTPQYAQLQELYKEYNKKGFEVLAFPCNDFGAQEPGSAENIREFCTMQYGVSFPIFEKISIKGKGKSDVYNWLTSKALNKVEDVEIQWNFQKFLINADGSYYKSLAPSVLPLDEEILNWLSA